MALAPLSLQKIEQVDGDGKYSTSEKQIMYSVVGLAPGIEIFIYQKMGKWWVTGAGWYWHGGHNSAKDALEIISEHYSARKTRADQ